MKKSFLVMAMVGLMLWFPLLADAGQKEDKWGKKGPHRSLQRQIDDLQVQIDTIEQGAQGPQGEQGDKVTRAMLVLKAFRD